MKKTFCRFATLLVAVTLTLGALADEWYDSATGYTWTYNVTDGQTEIGNGSSCAVSPNPLGALVIPSVLNGYPVTRIGHYAFSGCSGLTTVTIPEGVTSIGWCVFSDCSGLTSMTMPSSVTSIGWEAFSGCSGLTSVTIPSSVTSIGWYAFSGCSGLTSVMIPSSVINIGDRAFSNCSGLEAFFVDSTNPVYSSPNGLLCSKDGATLIQGVNGDVTIPSSVTSIGSYAFYGCIGLTSVKVPSSVTHIGVEAFRGTAFLADQPEGVIVLGRVLYQVKGSCPAILVISDGIVSIGYGAFSGCGELEHLTLPSSVTSIGDRAFCDCNQLTSIFIPSSVTEIGYDIFNGSYQIKDITAPACLFNRYNNGFWLNNVTNLCVSGGDIPNRAFEWPRTANLASLRFLEGVTSIGDFAFFGCEGLGSIRLPASLTSIGEAAFGNCPGLTSVAISSGVERIGRYAFTGRDLMEILVSSDNPTFRSVNGLLLSKDGTVLVNGVNGDVTIPSSVTSIRDYAFYDLGGLTSLIVPERVTNIGVQAFAGCTDLRQVYYKCDLPLNVGNRIYDYIKGDLVSYVLQNSVGWDVSTGLWQGHKIRYYEKPELIGSTKLSEVPVPYSWLEESYPGTSDFEARARMISANGVYTIAGAYVAGTDPTNPDDKFTASVTIVDGKPMVSWSPELPAEEAAKRVYRKLGKVRLTDEKWVPIVEGKEDAYNFFKVTVEMR